MSALQLAHLDGAPAKRHRGVMRDRSEYAAGIIHEPGTSGIVIDGNVFFNGIAEAARSATETGFTVAEDDGGVRLSWSDDPLDFVWQTKAQARDLASKLCAAAPVGPAQ